MPIRVAGVNVVELCRGASYLLILRGEIFVVDLVAVIVVRVVEVGQERFEQKEDIL